MGIISKLLPAATRHTLYLRYFGFTRIPLLYYARPSVIEMSGEHVVIKIPLRRRTRNHLGSMYFAALAMGADVCVGLLAVELINQQQQKIAFIFRDFNAEFYRRATGDVYFSCNQGHDIATLVHAAATQDERVELPLHAVATVPSENDEVVARFRLTLSLKRSSS
jgi:acyl-coenzyme A thioesterase PaaI-like protein